ncbi:MAG: bifunctional nuclease family protein [Chloroflexi bacterium]|nr:bifunctional nuclease family protein [Chloroflexota bacterium]
MVEVVIDCIRMSLMTQNRVVILKDNAQERYLPIWIGHFEADAITYELQEIVHKRPLTHDLLKSTISNLGGEVQRIVVTELRRPDDIFYAKIVVKVDDRDVEIDSRPSDAIALAVRVKVPIFVDESVMEVAAVVPEKDVEETGEEPEAVDGSDDRLQIFKDFVETLDLDNLNDDE